ncbi:jasmonate-regulated gene 21 [Zea mays]|uniref:Jasmonate-regulated gene 21 n=1 Tax=Zea mays TaxID=4577 RepID=A0A1D6N7V4_MAIZE|nr:jasmonate-regulated gene 21 [Zea mays]
MADCMQEWPEPVVRVQALAESGLSVIPRCYVKPPCDRPAVSPAAATTVQETTEPSDMSIPVVDLGALLAADGGAAVTEAVAAACREWGFFQVVGHGVRPELLRAAREAWRGFFRRPLAERQRYANSPRTYEGYGSRLGVQKGAALDWGDYFFLHLAPEAAKSTPKFWPAEYYIREVSEEYGREVVRLCELLMRVMSVSLGLDEAHLQRAFGGAGCCGATLRANYYPRCPQPDLTLGLSAHSDPGVLTALLADEHVRGLQVRRSAGDWVDVRPVRDAFIVNVGDQVQIMSNSVYKSVEHRVVVNAEEERISLAIFYNPKGDVPISPAPELVTAAKLPPLYPTMTFDEYRLYVRSKGARGKAQIEALKGQASPEN